MDEEDAGASTCSGEELEWECKLALHVRVCVCLSLSLPRTKSTALDSRLPHLPHSGGAVWLRSGVCVCVRLRPSLVRLRGSRVLRNQ